MFFATSAMLCQVRKSIKMVPTSIRKQLSNQHPNLDRFWSQLDSILGGFRGPRWGQDGTKSLQKSIQKSIEKMITFWIASRSIFDRFWAPTWPPRGVTDLYFLVIFSLLGPSWAQEPPKTPSRGLLAPPRPLQDASWDRFQMILASNLMVLRANLDDFRPQLDGRNSQQTNQPTN